MVGYCLLRGSHVASFPGFSLGTGSERLAFCRSMTYTCTCRVDVQSCITMMVCNYRYIYATAPYIMSGCGQATNARQELWREERLNPKFEVALFSGREERLN